MGEQAKDYIVKTTEISPEVLHTKAEAKTMQHYMEV